MISCRHAPAGGFNKLIKIYHDEGRYGFSAPYQFESVVSLIEFYRRESLAVYNADLDLTLRFPAKRPVSWTALLSVDFHDLDSAATEAAANHKHLQLKSTL